MRYWVHKGWMMVIFNCLYLHWREIMINILIDVTGTGCFVISVETAARRKAKVIGKPETIMFDCMNSW